MSTGDPEDFTLAAYAGYLELARRSGYEFCRFEELERPPELAILLRHDIDFSTRWVAPMAEVEHRCAATATYCFQPDSRNYEIASDATTSAVRTILELGHVLGLHFDATAISDDDEVVERVAQEARELGERFGTAIRTVSFHMPGRRPVGHLELSDGLINTYHPRFFERIGYVSDSNQHWRGKDLAALLRARAHPHLQLLIHPMWWRERPGTMLEKLEGLAADLGVDIGELLTPEQRALLSPSP
jgi:hypothetical protein